MNILPLLCSTLSVVTFAASPLRAQSSSLDLHPLLPMTTTTDEGLTWRPASEDEGLPVLYGMTRFPPRQRVILVGRVRDAQGLLVRDVGESQFRLELDGRDVRAYLGPDDSLSIRRLHAMGKGPRLHLLVNAGPAQAEALQSSLPALLGTLSSEFQDRGIQPLWRATAYGLGFQDPSVDLTEEENGRWSVLNGATERNVFQVNEAGALTMGDWQTLEALTEAFARMAEEADNPRRAIVWVTDGSDIEALGVPALLRKLEELSATTPRHREVLVTLVPLAGRERWLRREALEKLRAGLQEKGLPRPTVRILEPSALSAQEMTQLLASDYEVVLETRRTDFPLMDGAERSVRLVAMLPGGEAASKTVGFFTPSASAVPGWMIWILVGAFVALVAVIMTAVMFHRVLTGGNPRPPAEEEGDEDWGNNGASADEEWEGLPELPEYESALDEDFSEEGDRE